MHCVSLCPCNRGHEDYEKTDVLVPSALASVESQPAYWLRGAPARADTHALSLLIAGGGRADLGWAGVGGVQGPRRPTHPLRRRIWRSIQCGPPSPKGGGRRHRPEARPRSVGALGRHQLWHRRPVPDGAASRGSCRRAGVREFEGPPVLRGRPPSPDRWVAVASARAAPGRRQRRPLAAHLARSITAWTWYKRHRVDPVPL